MKKYRQRHPLGVAIAILGALAVILPLTAGAAPTTPAPSPSSAAIEAATAAEDVAVLKALAAVGLTRSQLAQLLPSLRGAQERLTEFEAQEGAKLATHRAPLEQARQDLLAGKGSGLRAQEQFRIALTTLARRRAGVRTEIVSSLRRTLDTILTPTQSASLVESGQAVLQGQRIAGWRGTPVRSGTSSSRGLSGRLDRIRRMSPAAFEQDADRAAARMGGRGSAQFRQYLALMQQVRSMPHSQYLLQRDQLAARAFAREGASGAAGNTNDAANAFVDRYLLSPRAPVVVAERVAGS